MSSVIKGPVGILTDTTKCIGCRECVLACKRVNHLEAEVPRRWTMDDGLSARNWTSIIERTGQEYVRKQCRHCLEPACVSVCPVGALQKTELGAVVYDREKCMGCRYCMMACPYGIPRYDWDKPVPYVNKCILCYDRLLEGGQPACTEACPTEATIFGGREELLAEAWRRIHAEPDKYVPHVWGEHEVGGTSVLYISDIDLGFLHYGRPLEDRAMPKTTAPAMTAVPFAFIGMGGAMAGLHWIIRRRMERMGGGQPESDGLKDDGKQDEA
ncbi:MAG TPA: 4Fe-4S dicluster domain-containing protein [Bacteroidetes bacterium]|nr:4Fe-4S dicluster domain-containing protein [Bacteroidota bacterium]